MHRTKARDAAAMIVADNWRIRQRLPHITAYARQFGFLEMAEFHGRAYLHCPWYSDATVEDRKGLYDYWKSRNWNRNDIGCCSLNEWLREAGWAGSLQGFKDEVARFATEQAAQ